MEVAGLFYGIGHQPNTSLISHRVELDESGYVKVSWQLCREVFTGIELWDGQRDVAASYCTRFLRLSHFRRGAGPAWRFDQRPRRVRCRRSPRS